MTFFARTRIVQAGVVVAAALLAAGAAAPLQAATDQQAEIRSSQNANTNAQRRICVRVALPNSRIPRPVCLTQAEWDRQGGVPTND